MKKTKKKASSHFVVVPNCDWKSTGKGASKTSTVVHRAAEATRKNRQYKLVKGNSGTYVVVTSKTSGQIISKFGKLTIRINFKTRSKIFFRTKARNSISRKNIQSHLIGEVWLDRSLLIVHSTVSTRKNFELSFLRSCIAVLNLAAL